MNTHISYLTLNDIHLGHRKTPTHFIVDNIITWFEENNVVLSKIDLLNFAGDVWEKLLSFSLDDISHGIRLWYYIQRFCLENNIIIRIIEGTRYHDRNQSKNFISLSEGTDLNVKYIEELSIEHIPELDLNILYIPDELNKDSSVTVNQIHKLLVKKHLERVDICCAHGSCHYQSGKHITPACFDEQELENVVEYAINIGHQHTYFPKGKVIPGGSFDRLRHGEEENKGAVVTHLTKGHPAQHEFLVNRRAKIYKTIQLSGETKNDLVLIKSIVRKLPSLSHVRLKAPVESSIATEMNELKIQFPDIYFTKDIERKVIVTKPIKKQSNNLALRKDNLIHVLRHHLESKEYTDVEISKMLEEMDNHL